MGNNRHSEGKRITLMDGQWKVPDNPIIPFIEGDGIGVDITPAMLTVVDAAVKLAYTGRRQIHWLEVLAGEKAVSTHGEGQSLPEQTLDAIKAHAVAIKGPLTTPVGGGFRSINVAIRQILDLYVCLRPVRHYKGVPSPVKKPEAVDMVIFRENSEDIYAGIEYPSRSQEARDLIDYLQKKLGVTSIRFPESSGIGIKPVSEEGSKRLINQAINYALENPGRDSVTLVHKGNIMKYTEGAFAEWGYKLAREQFDAKPVDGGPWHMIEHEGRRIIIKDVIADAFLQKILLNPSDFDVIATMNLNGDYISDALAAQVGGIGIAPGANLSDECAIFEATHGTAPLMAGMDKANPLSLILSAEMMLRFIGWAEAADLLVAGIEKTMDEKIVTYDFARLFEGVEPVKTSEYAQALVAAMSSIKG